MSGKRNIGRLLLIGTSVMGAGVVAIYAASALQLSDNEPAAAAETSTSSVMPPPVPADFERGRQVYDRWCAACHARDPGHPGTQSLEIKYGGAIPAALEDRSDLTPQITAHFVRNGAGLMPFFRRTEIGDADLRDLSAYLAEDE